METKENSLYKVESGFEVRKVKKGTLLLKQGEKSHFFYQVKKGCLRTFVISSSGKECVINLAPEGWVVGDLGSFAYGEEAILYIDALEDSEIVFFDKRMLDAVTHADREALLAEIGRSYKHIINNNKRFIQLLSFSAEERYKAFMQTYPSLVQRIPLKHIASYLGMTPEALSRIRKNNK